MKNLKLFIAPLVGAALLTACGSNSMNVKDFKTKIEEKFNVDSIKSNYVNKKQHTTGTMGSPFDETHEIADVTTGSQVYYNFTFKDEFPIGQSIYHVLSTQLVDEVFEKMKSDYITVNYFISGDTYTVESKYNKDGQKMSDKFVYNKDLVITIFEASTSGTGKSIDTHLEFTYDN